MVNGQCIVLICTLTIHQTLKWLLPLQNLSGGESVLYTPPPPPLPILKQNPSGGESVLYTPPPPPYPILKQNPSGGESVLYTPPPPPPLTHSKAESFWW